MKLALRSDLTGIVCAVGSVLWLNGAINSPALGADQNTVIFQEGNASKTPEDKVYDAEMPPPPEKKRGPLKKVFKAAGKELGTSFSDMGKDMVLVFSVQDVDPYSKSAPKDKPYLLTTIQWIDGTESKVIKYPDDSFKIEGGFVDGTVIVPKGKRTFTVKYPNGTEGTLESLGGGGSKIFRPDGSITTITKTMGGEYQISNDKIGFMGSAASDPTGLNFEMNTATF
jgi:hypothetical protein